MEFIDADEEAFWKSIYLNYARSGCSPIYCRDGSDLAVRYLRERPIGKVAVLTKSPE